MKLVKLFSCVVMALLLVSLVVLNNIFWEKITWIPMIIFNAWVGLILIAIFVSTQKFTKQGKLIFAEEVARNGASIYLVLLTLLACAQIIIIYLVALTMLQR